MTPPWRKIINLIDAGRIEELKKLAEKNRKEHNNNTNAKRQESNKNKK